MTDALAQAVLDHLLRIRTDFEAVRRETRDPVADHAQAMALLDLITLRLDGIGDRLERVEQKFGLFDA